jgi:hypothetical protein
LSAHELALTACGLHRGLVLAKDIDKFPTEDDTIKGGTIDAWWLVQRCGVRRKWKRAIQAKLTWDLGLATAAAGWR